MGPTLFVLFPDSVAEPPLSSDLDLGSLSRRSALDVAENPNKLVNLGVAEQTGGPQRVKLCEGRLVQQARVHHAASRQVLDLPYVSVWNRIKEALRRALV